MALKDTISSMKESNFQQFASEQEKRTREIMKSVERYEKVVTGENQAYMDAIKDAVEKSGQLSASNLKDGVKSLKDIENVIKAQRDIAEQDRKILLDAADVAKMQMEAKSQSGILGKIKETISQNAIDITSVAAGLSGNSPAIMFATKYVLDKRKEMKEEKQQRKKDQAEASLERLEGIAAAKANQENAKKEGKLLDTQVASMSSSASSGGSEAELVIWSELQATELERIRIGIDSFLGQMEISSRNDEENRREGIRRQEELVDAVEGIGVGAAVGGAGGEGGKGGGLMGMLSGAFSTLMGTLGANGLTGIMGRIGGLFAKAGPLASTIGRLATAAAPIASVAIGGAMIAKDVYDMASAALDNDITTEIEGKDMGGVIGGALLGTVGAFVGGPLGAGLGMALGNMVGSFVGDMVAPNYEEVFNESRTKIEASQNALEASFNTLEELYHSGAITRENFDAQRAVLSQQYEIQEQRRLEAEEVEQLNQTRLQAGQRYNDMLANIQAMEDAGLEVGDEMYATLDVLEAQYDETNEAFRDAAAELQAKVDPTWYQSLSQTLMGTWDSLSSAAASGFETMKSGFESARSWFADKIVALDNAFGISEGVANAVEYVEARASELAGRVADTVSETAAQVDAAITDTLAGVGLDDEYEAVRDAVGDAAGAAADMVGEVAGVVGDTATAMADAVDLSDGLDLDDVGNALGAGGEVLADAIAPAIERAGEFVEAGQEAVSEAVDAGIAAMGLEDEVAFVEDQLDAAGEAVQEVGEAISDSIGGMVDGVSDWWSSWWGDDAPSGPADGAAAAMPNLRAGNPHTEIDVDSGDAATRRDALIRQMDEMGVTDPTERAAIMAQAHHETGGFNTSEENFNYSGRRLFELYGEGNEYGNRVRFNSVEQADALVAQGQSAVGDVIYGGRMGNTDEGDGFKYRGRGAFQLTGRDNYRRYGEMIGVDLESNPELVNDPEIGAQVAVAYYQDRVSGRGIDSGNVDAVSRAINGGTVGLQDRRDLFASYMQQGDLVPSSGTSGAMLAGLGAENADLSAEEAAGASGGATVAVNAPVTNNSSGGTTVMGGMGQADQFLTSEEIMAIYGVATPA